ncbi:DNA cytosine methyltransferase [Thalassococcus sp. S3]|uniref:DNA cytosine methyltransferase n=1 Tax=Thalassococcus sp. S3 TaxID=2017482 RepID=UPI0010244C7D|nr:DNA cytosine methyltransferase [Thalassococcus sp. S3]QBF30068.1 DNA (cytosine-5-)-methyltransferase [Thalassococcus sp. S3]
MSEQHSRPIGIDLFAGAGGMSLGFERAGFDVKAAVEIDPVHCAAHKFNFPQTTVIPHSVEALTGADIRKVARIGKATVDCVFGGAPCQGFSLIGQRVLDDPRNGLVRDFVRLVAELDATSFVFENVKGLTLGKHRKFLYELVEAFEVAGYETRTPWKVLNAGHYGVPQSRERLILFGVKKGRTLPNYPAPMTNMAGRPELFPGVPFGPSSAEAIGDLPDADTFATLAKTDAVRTVKYSQASPYAAALRGLTNDAWAYGYVREYDPGVLTSSARTAHTAISKRRFSETEAGKVEPISRFFRLPPEGVSNTLRAGTDGARGAFTSPRPIHYRHARCVTVREMARLHGFPDWFRFHSTKWHGARQIGNAVPPPLAEAIATQVVHALNYVQARPEGTVSLGDPALLYYDMTEAAEHFNVAVPPSRRDRKSGAKKRKQEEIEAIRLGAGAGG